MIVGMFTLLVVLPTSFECYSSFKGKKKEDVSPII